MSTRRPGEDLPVRRIDRVLAFMSLGLIALSVVCFFAIIIGTTAGADFSGGPWPTIGVTVYIAPVLGFLLLIALLVMSFVRRARANKGR